VIVDGGIFSDLIGLVLVDVVVRVVLFRISETEVAAVEDQREFVRGHIRVVLMDSDL
jgi:hypothetical protein